MSDIFISYSREDSEQALQLAERLQGEGMSVWIDQRGIEAAKTWSEEIVNAIEGSRVFVLLLSSHSIESDNVVRELSLAFESKRTLLPLLLEDVILPAKFKYQLAGIQRVAYTRHDALTQALISCGISAQEKKRHDGRKSLLVMPFEDLSPTRDNDWFADGLVCELIDRLSHVRSLKLVDRKTAMGLKGSRAPIGTISSELGARYVIDGSIRKFGEQVKISVQLLDVEEGDYIWSDSFKGEFKDIFELQEGVAHRLMQQLKIHLTPLEQQSLEARETENPEAYILYLKAKEYHKRFTRESMQHAFGIYERAIQLDPRFAEPYSFYGFALLDYYKLFDGRSLHLERAEELIKASLKLAPDKPLLKRPLSMLLRLQGKLSEAEDVARELVVASSNDPDAHYSLAQFLMRVDRDDEAAACFKKVIELSPDREAAYYYWLTCLARTKNPDLGIAAEKGIPVYERKLLLTPDDDNMRAQLAQVYSIAGRTSDALMHANILSEKKSLDPMVEYNLACIYASLGEEEKTLTFLEKSFDDRYEPLKELNANQEFFWLHSNPRFKLLLERVRARMLMESDTTSPNA